MRRHRARRASLPQKRPTPNPSNVVMASNDPVLHSWKVKPKRKRGSGGKCRARFGKLSLRELR